MADVTSLGGGPKTLLCPIAWVICRWAGQNCRGFRLERGVLLLQVLCSEIANYLRTPATPGERVAAVVLTKGRDG